MNSGGNIGASGGGGGGGRSKWRAPSEEVLTLGDKRKNKVRTIFVSFLNYNFTYCQILYMVLSFVYNSFMTCRYLLTSECMSVIE